MATASASASAWRAAAKSASSSATRPAGGGGVAWREAGARVVAREPGRQEPGLPVWTDGGEPFGAVLLAEPRAEVERHDAPHVPGAFVLTNVLSALECDRIVEISETEMGGYTLDAPVSLGRDVRRNANCVWVASEALNDALFERVKAHLPPVWPATGGALAGLNQRYRLYRYKGADGDVFRPHTDGSWPGSGVAPNGELVHDRFRDGRWSTMTFLVYLNDDFVGGDTTFLLPQPPHSNTYVAAAVGAVQGAVLCFPHGEDPRSPLHEGSLVTKGTKYVLRSDVLYHAA